MHIRVFLYKCRNKSCNNEMTDKVLEGYEPVAAFHCNKCGLGRGKKLEFIRQHGAGMFPGQQPIEEYSTEYLKELESV
ncbi:hypothetical protein LCGC14_2903560 [marine sediment metagenome]|uniref:Uncharacterized protein n=1 Tax=marine sediment metagenome TaxID=412755 RepID=A0A0F9AJX2_9ZZZZ